jgi:nucleotide-binding universal stress UspA family protein
MYKKILVPMDGSRFGNRAMKYAIDLAQQYKASLLLVQVVQPTRPIPPVDPTGLTSPVASQITFDQAALADRRNLSRAKRYLAGKVREMKAKNIPAEYRATEGDAAAHIMEIGRKNKVDLIVMTTHGRSGFRRAIMGSVADKVIRESGDPVLVVRPYQRRRRRHK